jgi:hypothetical protein
LPGGTALRSADLLAQLRARNASAAAAGLSEAHGDTDDAEQVGQQGVELSSCQRSMLPYSLGLWHCRGTKERCEIAN